MLRTALLAAVLASFAGPSAQAHEFAAGQLELKHPWSRATPPGAQVAVGYVIIDNAGSEPDRLLAATAEVAGRVQMHVMSVKDGVMNMRQVTDGLPVPAKGELIMKPGSNHLMFLDLKRPLKQGEKIDGTLTFEKAGTVNVQFAVESMGETGPDHDMGKM